MIKSLLARPLAAFVHARRARALTDPAATQRRVLAGLLRRARDTAFGRAHGFARLTDARSFAAAVPVRTYEDLLPDWLARTQRGEADVLWPGRPAYLAQTSGTTAGTKLLPLTHESIPNHINAARDALLAYVHRTGRAQFFDGRLIFLSGSPALTAHHGLPSGRLSGIVNHHIPAILRANQLPTDATNRIDDWETKLDRIVTETLGQRMTLISGIPPWAQMYFDRLRVRAGGRPVGEIFPDFQLFVYGGVSFAPYRAKLFESIGRPVDSIELFPASEGFFAFQDTDSAADGLLLQLDAGIFYEFIPATEFGTATARRLTIGEVAPGENYALVVSTNAGLWAYWVGDTVRFTSLAPPRIVVTGRPKHFLSAFGEHVIGEEVEAALSAALAAHPETRVIEFLVAPRVSADAGQPSRHEWLVEFATP
ncbi:MAG: GH3 auxin-responsive promoter family protein, partial [Hymenobacteraceae bacterium]|nr:GH3 auxin-responsive promoter family protein [Hymenobacteraceae bacterium]